MAKKSIIAGEYIIEIADNGHVDVLRVHSNLYQTMRGLAKEKGFPVDEKWNTQTLGSKLVTEFGDGKTAQFGDVTVKRLPSQQIEISEECGHGNVKDALRAIAKKMGFPYDESWNTQTLGSKLVDYLMEHKEEADKILITPRSSRKSDAATGAAPSSSVIKITMNREEEDSIYLAVTATGDASIEGVKEPLQADGKQQEYTLTAKEVVIRGTVTSLRLLSNNDGIEALDLSGCPSLTSLDCSGYAAESLDLSKCVNLTELELRYCNQLTSLDLTKCVNLTQFKGEKLKQLTSLDFTKCVNLTHIDCGECEQLTSLDLSKCVNLSEFNLNDAYEITSLDVTKCVNLNKLTLYSASQLTSLDLTKCVNLTELVLDNCCGLTDLDLSKCVNLTEITLDSLYQLTSLDLSKLVNLTKLTLADLKLTGLDLSKLVNLTKLFLRSFDELKNLDLSMLDNLTELTLWYNDELTDVDISGCKKLEDISIKNTQGCDSLEVIRCHSEAVPKLDLDKIDFPVVKEEEGDVTLLINEKFAQKRKAGAKDPSEGQQANPDECPYTLMLCAGRRYVRATELFGFNEEDAEEVEHIKELINSGDTMELWENYYGEGKLFAIFDLWGDEYEEQVQYTITDENDNVIKKGNLLIEEDAVEDLGNPQPYITKDNHPKYLLLRREYRKNDTAYYKIPKDFRLVKSTFPYVTAFESRTLLDTDWMGDTRTGIQYGFRNNGVDYSSIMDSEFEDGSNDFALYEYDENRGGYNEVASTICDEE